MKSIGFKNFRRFANLDPLQLGDITFFVGGNNAGKSTVVKAMMLLLDNLSVKAQINSTDKTFNLPTFRLDANRIHEVHIGTFGRALHKPYPEQKELVLEAEIDNYHFRYVLTGDTDSTQANAEISLIEFTNHDTSVQYTLDFVKGEACIRYNTSVLKRFASAYSRFTTADSDEMQARLDELQMQRAKILTELKGFEGDAVQLARANSNYRAIDRQIARLIKLADPFEGKLKMEDVEYKCPIDFSHSFDRMSLLGEVLYSISERFERRISDVSGRSSESANSELSDPEIAFGRMVRTEARRISGVRSDYTIEYISAHAASQKVLFSIEDKNDYMASVIREFKQCRINKGDKEDIFITQWMERLNIGFNYEINPISGEAYTMDITNIQGETMPLADMGMGSIQLMILLLKLATIIREKRGRGCVVIVEEPEQNVHPKLQSKLAELFASVNREYGFRFVIETHSEYIIRKSQAMVANGEVEFEKNPFKVFFFPESGKPYDMGYQENGRFKETFDSGFFDEAAKWTSEISAVELKNAPIQDFKWEEK